MFVRCALVVCGAWVVAACDAAARQGTPDGTADDAVADEGASETASPEDVTPLDTALPFEVVQENHNLRNGVKARVGHVVDGDTVHIWVGNVAPTEYDIRLLGLAAPECFKDYRETPDGSRLVCTSDDEYYGLKSYEALVPMVEDKVITISCDVGTGEWCDTDKYGRYLAYLGTADGKDAATEMARVGAAMSYTVFDSSKRADICRAEYDARDAKRGMWALGSIDQVLAGMHSDTRGWYNSQHDRRCDAAIAADH